VVVVVREALEVPVVAVLVVMVTTDNGDPGTANTGGAGGGGGPRVTAGGNGGSGVVIFTVPTTRLVSFSGGVTQDSAVVGLNRVYTVTETDPGSTVTIR